MNNATSQVSVTDAILVTKGEASPHGTPLQFALFSPSGAPLTPLTSQSNKVAARADVAAATSTAAAGATPTKAEFDALRNDYLALRTAFNDLLGKMRTAGILA